ncbi:hypothetical protein, partial [Salmonella enterica]|uniref:hypothetical protein n=1 Tax=Salmonella enterica TaxID=28901 RepID=UPI001F204D81
MLNPTTYKLHNINMLWQYFVDLKIAKRYQSAKAVLSRFIERILLLFSAKSRCYFCIDKSCAISVARRCLLNRVTNFNISRPEPLMINCGMIYPI